MNRLVKTTEGSEITEYLYDNAGNRFIKKTPAGTTVYLRHGQIVVAMDIEMPPDTTEIKGNVNRYILSGDLLAGRITTATNTDDTTTTIKSYYHLDHLNSTKCVTNESGTIEVMYEYRAFGEQLKRLDADGEETDDSAKYSYGGKELDEGTNLYYFNARYYDATIGRFINVDPVQDGSNWYTYVNNNPLNFIDPTGLEDEEISTEDFDISGKGPGEEDGDEDGEEENYEPQKIPKPKPEATPDPNADPIPETTPYPTSAPGVRMSTPTPKKIEYQSNMSDQRAAQQMGNTTDVVFGTLVGPLALVYAIADIIYINTNEKGDSIGQTYADKCIMPYVNPLTEDDIVYRDTMNEIFKAQSSLGLGAGW